MKKPYKKLQDNDCHWYRIPNELIEEFEKWNEEDPKSFEFDESKFDSYRTYGHPDNIPPFYEDNQF